MVPYAIGFKNETNVAMYEMEMHDIDSFDELLKYHLNDVLRWYKESDCNITNLKLTSATVRKNGDLYFSDMNHGYFNIVNTVQGDDDWIIYNQYGNNYGPLKDCFWDLIFTMPFEYVEDLEKTYC